MKIKKLVSSRNRTQIQGVFFGFLKALFIPKVVFLILTSVSNLSSNIENTGVVKQEVFTIWEL